MKNISVFDNGGKKGKRKFSRGFSWFSKYLKLLSLWGRVIDLSFVPQKFKLESHCSSISVRDTSVCFISVLEWYDSLFKFSVQTIKFKNRFSLDRYIFSQLAFSNEIGKTWKSNEVFFYKLCYKSVSNLSSYLPMPRVHVLITKNLQLLQE